MAKVNATALGSPWGKVSWGAEPPRASRGGIAGKTTPATHGDSPS